MALTWGISYSNLSLNGFTSATSSVRAYHQKEQSRVGLWYVIRQIIHEGCPAVPSFSCAGALARNALHAAVPASLLCSLLPLSRGHAASYPVLFLLSGPYCILRLAQCAVPHRYVCWLAAQPLVLLGCVVNLCLSLSLGVSSYTQFVMFWALSE